MIPIARPSVGSEELSKIKEVLESGWLGMGALVGEFENKVKQLLGVENAVAVNTGTSALHIALDAFGITAGDEVIVPSLTFVASVQAIVSTGATPVFCDIYPETLTMDMEDAHNRITPRTKAIMPVHYGGMPCAMDELRDIVQGKNIFIIEDAAHAFGSRYKDKMVGCIGDATCFSFDPIKVITCGEGGMVTLKNTQIAGEIIKKRILGIDRDTWYRYKQTRSWFYEVTTAGFRYHMSNINAAIGLVQLGKLDRFIRRRREIIKQYDRAFADLPCIELLKRDYEHIAPFNYIIKVSEDREKLMADLKENGIESGIHYIPNHLHPLFKNSACRFPHTEEAYAKILSLPLYYDLSPEEVEKVIDHVTGFFKK